MPSYVYKLTNKINKKIYVGKSKNPVKRLLRHFEIAYNFDRESNNFQYIHAAIKKHGKENFILEILETCNDCNQAYEKEIYWILLLKSNQKKIGYNLTSGGDGVKNLSEESKLKMSKIRKGKKLSEETKKKISQSNKGKHFKSEDYKLKMSKARMGLNNPMFNKTISEETRKKLSEFQSSRKRKPLSEEHKKALSEARKKQDMSFKISNELKSELRNLYNMGSFTKKQLAEKFNLKINSVIKILRNPPPTTIIK